MPARAARLILLACALAAGPCSAAQPPSWHDVKCSRYRTAWSHALTHLGTQGLSAAFLARHEAFLASNCTGRSDVCPHSPEEFRLADTMVVLSMNAGTASTFPPFACPK